MNTVTTNTVTMNEVTKNALAKNAKLGLVALAFSVLAVGCNNKSTEATSPAGYLPVINSGIPGNPGVVLIDPSAPSYTGGGSAPSSSITQGGSSVDFKPVSLQAMNEYVATRPLNNPSNFKVNVNLSSAGSGRYGGSVSISYVDNGIQYNGVFKAGLGSNQSFKGMYDNGRLEADYNYWFSYQNRLVFTGFFEDQYGAVTITLEPMSSTPSGGNDAEPVLSGPYRGTIYFKNFQTTFAQHSPYRSCWFTYMGPYDCRSNIITTKCGLYPGADAGYKILGTFENIDIKKGFNIQ